MFKLEYVNPKTQGETSIVEIELDDISMEIEYLGKSVVCYVPGAYPPFAVIQGYIKRLWGKLGIDRIAMLKNRVIVVKV